MEATSVLSNQRIVKDVPVKTGNRGQWRRGTKTLAFIILAAIALAALASQIAFTYLLGWHIIRSPSMGTTGDSAEPFILIMIWILGSGFVIGPLMGCYDIWEHLSKESSFKRQIAKHSQGWRGYRNNLDDLLGIETVDISPALDSIQGLFLNSKNQLLIDSSYDWYIVDKMPVKDVFKIVGLSKVEPSNILMYLLGKDNEPQLPYLISIPAGYAEVSCEECIIKLP